MNLDVKVFNFKHTSRFIFNLRVLSYNKFFITFFISACILYLIIIFLSRFTKTKIKTNYSLTIVILKYDKLKAYLFKLCFFLQTFN